MFACNLFVTAPSDLMNSSKTHQDVLSSRHWLLPRCMPSFVCVILCALTIIILITMTDNDVLHKGSSHLYTHINKSYKTRDKYTNTSNYLLCTYHIVHHCVKVIRIYRITDRTRSFHSLLNYQHG